MTLEVMYGVYMLRIHINTEKTEEYSFIHIYGGN